MEKKTKWEEHKEDIKEMYEMAGVEPYKWANEREEEEQQEEEEDNNND